MKAVLFSALAVFALLSRTTLAQDAAFLQEHDDVDSLSKAEQDGAAVVSDEDDDPGESGGASAASQRPVDQDPNIVAKLHARLADATAMEKRIFAELQHQGQKLRSKIKALKGEIRQKLTSAAQGKKKLKEELAGANLTLQQTRQQLEEQREKDEELVTTVSELRAELARARKMNSSNASDEHRIHASISAAQRAQKRGRLQLAATRKTASKLKTLLNKTAKIGGHLRNEVLKEKHVLSDLQLRNKNRILSSQKEMAKLRMQLAEAERVQQQLRAQLSALTHGEGTLESRLRTNITRARAAEKRMISSIVAKNRQNAQLSSNLTRVLTNARAAAEAAHKDHVGMLLSVTDLQDQTQSLQQKVDRQSEDMREASRKRTADQALEKLSMQEISAKQQHQIADLLQGAQTMKGKMSKALAEVESEHAMSASLQQQLAAARHELRAVAAAFEDAAAARDAANQKLAASSKQGESQSRRLEAARKELVSLRAALADAKAKTAAETKESNFEVQRRGQLQQALEKALKAGDQAGSGYQKQLQQMEVTATLKVRAAQDEAENLKNQLKTVQASLKKAQDEGAKAKDSALKEADEALQASHREEELNSQVSALKREVDTNKAHAEELQKSGDSLRNQRDQAEQQLEARTRDESDFRAKYEALHTSSTFTSKELKQAQEDNSQLRSKADELMDVQQRADAVSQEVEGARNALQKAKQQNEAMRKQLEMLRDLKDRYTEENDQARNETSTWHSQADDLQAKIQREEAKLKQAKEDRDEALSKAKEASSRENTYFDDNSHLQSTNEAFSAQLADAVASANRSTSEVQALKSEMERLQDEKRQDQENSHAAWVEAENELLASKKDVQNQGMTNYNLQAELTRERALLNDQQRKALGLPAALAARPAAQSAAVPATVPAAQPPLSPSMPASLPALPAVPAVMTVALPATMPVEASSAMPMAMPAGPSAGSPAVVPLSHQLVSNGPTAAPMTPQFAHLKRWTAPASTPHLAALQKASDAAASTPDAADEETPLQKLAEYISSPPR